MRERRETRANPTGSEPSLTLPQPVLVRLFDRLPLPVWINAGHRGTTWVNQAMVEFTGRSMVEECGPQWPDTIHPDDREEYLATFFAAHERRVPCEYTYRLRSASGEYRWMLNRSTPWTDTESGTFGYIGVCTDITAQKVEHLEVEHAAHLSSLVLDISTSLLSCSPSMIPVELTSAVARIGEHLGIDRVGIALLEEEHGNMSLAYHWINPEVEDIFVTLSELPAALQPRVLSDLWAGRPVVISDAAGQLPGWEVDQVMWKARRIGATCVVPAPIRGTEVGVTFFETLERPFGWGPSVESLVVLGKIMGAAMERWHLDRVLTESERHYRLLTEQSNDIVAVIDAAGQFTYVSPSVERTLGHRVDDLLGMWVFDIIHPDDVVHETPIDMLTWTIEQRLVDAEHEHRWFEITYTVPTDPDTGSSLPVLFLTAHDISDKRAAEDRMRTRMQFEDIVLGLSTRILEEGSDHIDHNIATALEYFGVFLDVDDVALFEIDHRSSVAWRRHEWSGPQLTPASERIALSDFPRLMSSLERGLAVAIDDASTRDLDMARELFDSEMHPGGALLLVPLMSQRTVTGFLRLHDGSGTRVWNDGDMSVLQLAAEVIGNALALKKRDQALRQSEERFRLLAQDSADVIIRCDTSGVMAFVSDASRQLIGMEPSALEGRNLLEFVVPHDQPTIVAALSRLDEDNHHSLTIECQLLIADGLHRSVEATVRAIVDADGRAAEYQCAVRDITDRKAAAAALARQATHDALTDLPNRRLMHQLIEAGIQSVGDNKTRASVLFCDLDGFKAINDVHGHDAGDAVLLEVAARLQRAVRSGDVVGRFGGDEFVVLLPDTVALEDSDVVAGRIVDALSEPIQLDNAVVSIGSSVGIVTTDDPDSNVTELLRLADAAMYRAKQAGKGCWRRAVPGDVSEAT